MATAIFTAAAATYTPADRRSYPLYPHPAIHGFNVPMGVYISPPDQYEALLGRRLAPTPDHLTSRTLYIPSHNEEVTHLPVYDFTKEYKEAVRNEPIGSSRFKTNFGLMKKPVGDGRGASEVSYLVDFEPPEVRKRLSGPGDHAGRAGRRKSSAGGLVTTHATVRRRMLYGGAEVGLTIPPRPLAQGLEGGGDDGAVACTITPGSTGAGVRVVTSYPLRPTMSRFGSSRNPWFTFTVPGLLGGERTLQWQVHPVEHGLLRYTLVEIPRRAPEDDMWWEDKGDGEAAAGGQMRGDGGEEKPPFSASERENEDLIRAIYHNVGLGFCLSQPFSEGALLLQDGLHPEFEAVIVASLLGLLWRARGEESKQRKGSKGDAPAGKSSKLEGGAMVGETSVGVAGVDEKGPASRTSVPGKKGIFGKILRRMS